MKLRWSMAAAMGMVLALCGPPASATEAGFERMKFKDYLLILRDAHLARQKKQFERAFTLHQRNACGGDKGSQFALGSMYLLGEGTEPDALRAYAWLKAAAEAKEPRYLKAVAALEAAIPDQHRAVAEAAAAEVIRHYGLEATHMTCLMRAEAGTRIAEQECKPPVDIRNSMVEVKLCE